MGIYLDDYASGAIVESNYLQNCIRGIAVGGGRDNHLRGNVIHGGLAAIQIDARGLTWYQSHVQGHDSRIQTLCRNTLVAFPIYQEKYPALAKFLNDEPEQPKGNRVESNEFNCRIGIDLQMVNKRVVEQKNNIRQSATEPAAEVIAKLGIQLWKETNHEQETTVFVDTRVDLRER
jgi:parallel beta-helix repeat protein